MLSSVPTVSRSGVVLETLCRIRATVHAGSVLLLLGGLEAARLRVPITHTLRGAMMTSQPDVRPSAPDRTQPLKRRGLLAASVALVAGLVAKLTEQPVSAGVDGDVVLGASNTTGGTTVITNTTFSSTAMAVSCMVGPSGWGLLGSGSQYGILGQTNGNGAGVYGIGNGKRPWRLGHQRQRHRCARRQHARQWGRGPELLERADPRSGRNWE